MQTIQKSIQETLSTTRSGLPRVSEKTRVSPNVFHKCLLKVVHECCPKMFSESVLQECRQQVSSSSILQEFLPRVSHKVVLQWCLTRVLRESAKSVLQECRLEVSHNSAKQKYLTRSRKPVSVLNPRVALKNALNAFRISSGRSN